MTRIIEELDAQQSARAFSDRDAFALDVLVGLSETRKTLPSKYMYDDEGSRLFEQITRLPEYYLTDCELDTLQRHRNRIADYAPRAPFHVIEFGAGSLRKPGILIDRFVERGLDFESVPVDMSREAMESLAGDLERRYPEVAMRGLVSDYLTGIHWLTGNTRRRSFVLFLGSNIGNFNRAQATLFLRKLWNGLSDGDVVLIGFDLRKDIELLLAAYNDSQGVTKQFNLNLMRRINRELGGHFNLDAFRHFATYDVISGAMESYLVSQGEQDVYIEAVERSFSFHAWEPIHTEYSYKYLESDIDLLAQTTGFRVKEHLYDSKGYFVDSLWEVHKTDAPGSPDQPSARRSGT